MIKKAKWWFVFGLVVFFLILAAVKVQERNECLEWQRYEGRALLVGLESEQWQKDQCLNYDITLNY